MTITQKLQAVLAAHIGETGPVAWSVEEREDGGASLVATYEESATHEGHPLDDEPWKIFGGDAIIKAAGLDYCDGGMDAYQDNGENWVCQWAIIKGDDAA